MEVQHPKPLSHVLLISDMDDTLLSSKKEVSPRNLAAIQKLRDLGGLFTIATGRSIQSYLPYREQLQISLPVVLNNGSVLYHPETGKILWHSVLPKEAKQYVAETIRQFPTVGAEVMLGEEVYVVNSNQQIIDHMETEHLQHIDAVPDQIPDNWFKVLYAMEPDELPIFCEYLAQQNYQGVTYVTSTKRYCEMLPEGVSKGRGLQEMIRLCQMENRTVYAVGDYYNDLSMIELADVGAAVANAPDDVKKKADLVLSSNQEDAIAELIEIILNREKDRL